MAQNLVASGGLSVQLPRRLPQKDPRRLQLDLQIGQPELQRLELVDGGAEGLAFAHVIQRRAERRLRPAEAAGRDVEPPAVQPDHGVFEAVALEADQIFQRHQAIVELHLPRRLRAPAHLVLEPAEGQPLGAVLDDQGGNPLGAVAAGAAHDDVRRPNSRRPR